MLAHRLMALRAKQRSSSHTRTLEGQITRHPLTPSSPLSRCHIESRE